MHASTGALLYWTAVEAMRLTVSLQLDALGATPGEIGVAVAAYAGCGLVLAIPGGRIVDRAGARRLLILAFAALALAGPLYLLGAGSVVGLALVQMVAGAAALLVWLALQTAVAGAGEGDALRRHLALFGGCWAVGAAIGPLMGSWLFASAGFASVVALLVAAGVLGVFLGSRLPRVTDGGARRPTPSVTVVRELVGDPTLRLVLGASFVSIAMQALRTSFLPLYLIDRGFAVGTAGLVLTGIASVSLVMRLLLAPIGRLMSAPTALVASTWLAVVAMTATPLLARGGLVVLVVLGVGTALGLHPPISVEMVATAAPDHLRGSAMGLRVAANRAAQLLQPLVFGVVAGAVGTGAAFVVTGVALGAVFLPVQWRGRPAGPARMP